MKTTLHFSARLVLILHLFLFAQVLYSATIYVNSSTGNDATGNGTSGNPYKTFHKGYSMASSGDIIDLTGTFTWTDADETGDAQYSGYTINKNLTIQGQSGSETIIQAAATSNTADRCVLTVKDATVILKYLTIRYGKNTATTGYDVYGGGISCGYGTGTSSANTYMTMENCRIVDNISVGTSGMMRAGGLSSMSSVLTIKKCDFSNNSASGNFYGAGGVYITRDYGSLIETCSISNNEGYDLGGPDNSHATYNGGITLGNCHSGNLAMTNTTVANNFTNSYGGGVGAYPRWSTITLTNVTIAENSSSGTVYGGMHTAETSGSVLLKNTLIANNKCSSGTPVDFYKKEGTVTDNGYNAVESTTNYTWGANTIITGFENINLSSGLALNGSLNISKTLALASGSIAIDAGNNTANGTVNIPTTDQRGMNRNGSVDIGAYEYGGTSGTASWTGGASTTNWAATGNWSGGVIPNSGYAVTIPGSLSYYPIIDGSYTVSNPAACMNLTIENGASITINAGKALTVNGTLTNSGGNPGIIIQSSADGTGSLIHNSADIAATVNTYITGSSTLTAKKYHFVSIPTYYESPTSNLFLGSYIYKLDPTTTYTENHYGNWIALGTSTNTELQTNQGYMIYYPGASTTYTFEGNLNNGNYTYSLTGHSGAGVYTFNLIPNPYPSSIVWNTGGTGWTESAGVGGTCYLWNASAGNYTSLASANDAYIPIGQALMVLVTNEDSPTLSVNNNARTHSSQTFYKSGLSTENQLIVKAYSNDYADETKVQFSGEATEGLDLQTDGMKLFGLEEAPQLYTLSGNEKYSINNLPVFEGQKIVPMNFETQFTGEVTLTFSGIESFDLSLNIYLQDLISNKTINLRQQQVYTFSHSPENPANRFNLVFGGTIGINETENGNMQMWISGNTLYLNTPEKAGQSALLEVFDVSGKMLTSRTLTLNELTTIELKQKGLIIVRLTTGEDVWTTKGILTR